MIEAPLADVLEWLFRTRPPAHVEAKARLLVLDTLGCAIAGRRHAEVAAFGKQLEATDPGSASSSAALFAAAACWDEACEGLARAHGRPGIAALAACSALATRHGFSCGKVIEAYVTGYEIGGRLGEAMRIAPGMHVDATWPSFGAAAAVVRLLGGTPAQALTAIRIAACQLPQSLYLPITAGANARNTYLGHAAQLGMLAASAALGGIVAPAGALQGTALAAKGEWLILEGYLKPYAAVRHVHYGAAAAQALRPEIGGRLQDIRGIELSVYKEALTYCGNRAPKTAIQAQFSLSYGVACMLATGRLAPESYDAESLQREDIRVLEALIETTEREDLSIAGQRGATLSVELRGEILFHAVECIPGDPDQPMSREAVLAKFASYSGRDGRALLEAPETQAWKPDF
jgi:2-methylcitrate dehydratase PrpD